MRLPRSLQSLVDGLKGSSGPRSLLSPSTLVGEKPAQVPIVLYLSHEHGSSTWITALGGISALSEDVTGERILMLSWDLGEESPFKLSETPGGSVGIRYDLLIPIGGLAGMLPNTSSKRPISGISGVPCDGCRRPIEKGQPYRTDVEPPHGLRLLCLPCASKERRFMA